MNGWMRSMGLVSAAAVVCVSTTAAQLHDMTRFMSGKYEVFTDMPRRDAEPLARHMDSVFSEYERRLSSFTLRDGKRSKLYLFKDRRAYLEGLGRMGIDARGSGGMFIPVGANGDSLATYVGGNRYDYMIHTLQHEGFHQFANKRIGNNLPVWANEGMAEYFGYAPMVRGRLRTGVFGELALEKIRAAIRNETYLPFDDLLTMSLTEWNRRLRSGDPRARTAYLQSRSVVHFLIHADRGKYQRAFEGYLRLIADGLPPLDALEKAFGTREFGAFEKKWAEYVLEEQEADAISTAGERLLFMAKGIQSLYSQGETIDSIEDLRSKLIEAEFEYEQEVGHGAEPLVMSAKNASLFEAPEETRGSRKMQGVLEIVPSEEEGGWPSLRITGLSVKVGVTWVRGEDGEPEPRIVYG